MLRTPCGSEFAPERLGENGLGELVDPDLGVPDPLFDLVGEGGNQTVMPVA